jgi:hypothetical protein
LVVIFVDGPTFSLDTLQKGTIRGVHVWW